MNVIDRYRQWNRLAYLSTSEKRLNKSLWALLAVSVGYAVVHHVRLVDIPAQVDWGPPFGVVCYDLAIAYAGAFTFYLLNVRLPLRRDRRNIYRTVGPLVGLVVMHCDQMMTALNKVADIDPPDRENSWENVADMCSKISLRTTIKELFVSTKGIAQKTVFSVIVDHMNRTRTGIQQILSFSSFLATDLIDLLSAIESHSHFRTISQHVMMVENTGLPIGNNDMSLWAHEFFNYTAMIRDLKEYGQRYLTMTYEDRPGLMRAEDNPAVPKPVA